MANDQLSALGLQAPERPRSRRPNTALVAATLASVVFAGAALNFEFDPAVILSAFMCGCFLLVGLTTAFGTHEERSSLVVRAAEALIAVLAALLALLSVILPVVAIFRFF